MPKSKEPTLAGPNAFGELAEAVASLTDQVTEYTRKAGNSVSADELEAIQQHLGRIVRDAADANVALYSSIRIARTNAQIRTAFDNAERNPPNRSVRTAFDKEPSK